MNPERKIDKIYSDIVITQKVVVNFSELDKNIEKKLHNKLIKQNEGKCIDCGYIKNNSIVVNNYSSGELFSDKLVYEVMFKCQVCNPVENMLIICNVKSITKAGVRCEIDGYDKSPLIIFLARDHHYNNKNFSEINEGDNVKVKVIGKRFEINDEYICVISELIEKADKIESIIEGGKNKSKRNTQNSTKDNKSKIKIKNN